MADGVDLSFFKEAANADPFEFQNKLLANQHNQMAVQADQIKLATERFGAINNAASGLLSDPDLGTKDITSKLWDTLGRLTKGDTMTAQHVVQFMQSFPDGATPTGLAKQRQAIMNVYSQTLEPWQRGKAWLGENQPISTGGGTKFIQQPAFGNSAPQDRGFVPNTLSPGTPVTNPNTLQQDYAGGTGNPPVQGPATAAPRARPAAPATPMAAPPPGAAEAARATGQGSGEELVGARHRSLNYQQEVFPLEQAIPALEKLGTKGTGPGTESINHLKSFVLSNIPGADFKGLKDDVATYDKAKKYLTDFVNQNGNSSTNDKLAAAFAGNPSVNISNAAAVDVAKSALALRRMKQAQLVAFEQSGLPDKDYAKFASKWAVGVDPRAFGFDMMTVAQRNAVLNSISDKKGKDGAASPRDLFKLQVEAAHESGLLHNPQSK